MKFLPDPRRFDSGHDNALVALARKAANGASATQQENFLSLCAAIADALADGCEAAVREAGRLTGSAAATALYWRAVEQALLPPPENALQIRVFAIPILIVAGGRADAIVSGVVPDPAALGELLARAGAFGPMRNFGLCNALATAESLASVALTELYRIARAADPVVSPGLDLPPEDIRTATAEEAVYLRFFAGAAVTAHGAPSLEETAASVGAWGMPFTRALSTQLQTPGLSLLPVPRPPQAPLQALRTGRFAHRELGFQLFLSNALRKARMRSGDPDVTLAAHADASIQVRLTSPFDESLDEQYRWPLDPADDFAAVTNSICSLFAECRLDRIEILDTLQAYEDKQ